MSESFLRQEAKETGAATARLLEAESTIARVAAEIRRLAPRLMVVCGRGSSGHVGTYLRYVASQRLGIVTADALPSVASVYGRDLDMQGALFVVISQSGRSPDIVAQVASARRGGAFCLGLLNDTASPVAAECHAVLDIAAGPERSVAATKTVIASIAAGLAVLARVSNDDALSAALHRLPERLNAAASLDWSGLADALAKVDRMFTIGRGIGLAVASEAALKLAEVTGTAGLAYSSAELLHGPMALAGRSFPVLAFVQKDAALSGTEATVSDLVARGVPVFTAGIAAKAGCNLPTLSPDNGDVDLLSQLTSFYLAVEMAARTRGRDPDNPPALRKVTETI